MLGPSPDAPGDTPAVDDVLGDPPFRVPAPPRLTASTEPPAPLPGLDGGGVVVPGVSPGRGTGTVGTPGPTEGGMVGTVGVDTGPAAAAARDVPPTTRPIAHT